MDKDTYVHILAQVLSNKNSLLDRLIEITLKQEAYILAEPLDMDQFEQTLPDKEVLIEQLNQLDEGFDKIYNNVRESLSSNKNLLKHEILQLQELIKQVTEKSVTLQSLELKNKNRMESYFLIKKKEIRDFKMSSQTVSKYYKSSTGQQMEQSYFLDKKK